MIYPIFQVLIILKIVVLGTIIDLIIHSGNTFIIHFIIIHIIRNGGISFLFSRPCAENYRRHILLCQ